LRLASNPGETLVGSFQGGATGHDAEPTHPDDRSAEQRALARIEHDERVDAVKTLKPREREALYLKGLGYSYHEIADLSRGSRVNVAVLVRLDVGDMSLMEASRLPSSSAARPRARRARLLLLPRCDRQTPRGPTTAALAPVVPRGSGGSQIESPAQAAASQRSGGLQFRSRCASSTSGGWREAIRAGLSARDLSASRPPRRICPGGEVPRAATIRPMTVAFGPSG
jgi:hypothetical protein